MHVEVVGEELMSVGTFVLGDMQIRLGRREQNRQNVHPATPHFIETLGHNPEVSRIRSIKQIYGLSVAVESNTAPKNFSMQALTWLGPNPA
jgi:hypothetical protein